MIVWPKWTLRGIGSLDLIMAIAGVFFYAYDFSSPGNNFIFQPERLMNSKTPYVYQAYCVDMVIDLVCVLLLTLAGLSVIRLKPRGLWMSNVALSFKIGTFLLAAWAYVALLPWGERGRLIGLSIAAAEGIGHPATNLQVMIAYPVWALILTNIAYRKLPREQSK